MKYRRKSHVITFVFVGLLFTAIAWARPMHMKVFTDTYNISGMSMLGKASCAICHPSKTSTATLNPYGKDLLAAMKLKRAKTLTKAILLSKEKADSDRDGFSNVQEIKAGTLPGDPNSHPTKKK
ncbi:MAG: hypothetical protein M1133_08255 [Armatimonadetes bacterium]|nr:hypothetical protein [Armatimonadota bacterium]